jgi:hypothetical protein
VPHSFKPSQVFGYQLRSEIGDADLVGFHLSVRLAEYQEQFKCVSIGGDGVRTQVVDLIFLVLVVDGIILAEP